MKELEALGWEFCPEVKDYTRTFSYESEATYMVSLCQWRGDEWIATITQFGKDSGVCIPFPSQDEALLFVNSAACCTPENPKGRWVE